MGSDKVPMTGIVVAGCPRSRGFRDLGGVGRRGWRVANILLIFLILDVMTEQYALLCDDAMFPPEHFPAADGR
jgi:hypothetical protein